MSLADPVEATDGQPFPHTPEQKRLLALRSLGLLDTAPSESFDLITRLASQIFDLPIAAIALSDEDRQWFKSRIGLERQQMPRDGSPCAEVIESQQLLVLNDLFEHKRYANGPLAQNGIRFYAGAPLVTRDGHSLGTMCVLATAPRTVTADEYQALRDLASLVMAQIELEHAFGRVDPVTGLPSRNQFIEDMEDLARDHEGELRHATLIDLADASDLAQTTRVCGPAFIDTFVNNVTQAIQQTIGRDTPLYMAGAMQCIYLVEELDEKLRATQMEVLRRCIRRAVNSANPPVLLRWAVGVVPFRLGEADPQDVLRKAHSAAEDARRAERTFSLYSPKTRRSSEATLSAARRHP